MADLDLAALRLDAARRNGGGRESRVGPDLARRLEQFVRERDEIARERAAVRREWLRVTWAWGLLVLTTILLGAGWPVVLQFADWVWAR